MKAIKIATEYRHVDHVCDESPSTIEIEVEIVGFSTSSQSLDACNRLHGGHTVAVIIEDGRFSTCALHELKEL